MLVFKRSRRFRLYCCPADVATIYDLGAGASPVQIRWLVPRYCPGVGGCFLQFQVVVMVWLIFLSSASAGPVVVQAAAVHCFGA
jgi:hypothetical protein